MISALASKKGQIKKGNLLHQTAPISSITYEVILTRYCIINVKSNYVPINWQGDQTVQLHTVSTACGSHE